MTAVPADAEQLGSEVWEALVAAGHEPAPKGSGEDGFEVLRSITGLMGHVVINCVFEGWMLGLGTKGVRRSRFYRYERDLQDAGYVVRRFEPDLVPVLLVVARTASDADAGLTGLVNAHSAMSGGRRA